MKVLVMLSFTTLCWIFGLGTGAVVKQEMPADTELLMKDVVENGVKYFAKTLATEDSGSLMKNNLKLDDEDYITVEKEVIGEYPSSFSLEENDDDENMLNWNDIPLQKPQDPSKMTDSKMKCAWDAETYRCCKPMNSNVTACIGAGIADEKIHISLQIDGTTVWKKTISYKATLEKIVRAATTMVAGNDGVKDFDPESFSDVKELIKEDGSDITEIIDEENSVVSEKTAYNQKKSLLRRRFQYCLRIRVFGKRFVACFIFIYNPPAQIGVTLKINNYVIWSQSIGTNGITISKSIFGLKFYFRLYDLHFNRQYVRACLRIYTRLVFWRYTVVNRCLYHRFGVDEIPSAATKKPGLFIVDKETGNILFPRENLKGNTLKFEQQDFI